jgi:hypothetical protein
MLDAREAVPVVMQLKVDTPGEVAGRFSTRLSSSAKK